VLEATLADLPSKKVTKSMRDTIMKAPLIDGTYWVTWDLTSKAVIEEACTLAAARVGEVAAGR
jgi:dihydroxyacetone kinase DhaKLM complex PTS-EIIA-like component DhaM